MTVRVRLDVADRGGRLPRTDLGEGLAGLGGEGGDVDQSDDVGQVTGLGDHRAAVGVADEQDRSVGLADHLLGAGGVVGERRQGVLHGVERVVAAAVQLDDDLRPVGGTAPETVDEDDVRLVVHELLLDGVRIGR